MAEVTEEVGGNALQEGEVAEVAAIEAPEAVIEEPQQNEAEVAQNSDPEPKQHHLKGKTPWYMERINEETNKRRLVEEQLTQRSREAEDARAMLERLQAGEKATPATKPTDPQDLDALIDARAEQKLFNNDCNTVASRGQRDIPGFNDKLDLLRSIGVVNDEFLKDIFAVDKDNAHTILDSLSQDPEKASLMVKMDSRKRISELTRTLMAQVEKPAAPAPKPVAVSKVPAPKPVVNASAGVEDIDEDKMSDEDWARWRKKEMAKKFG